MNRVFATVVFVCVAVSAHAQVLSSPSPVERLSDVTQFGMRPDGQFVLCDGVECPQRTAKHFAAVEAPRVTVAPLPSVTESPARARPPAKHVRRHRIVKRHRPALTCAPGSR